MSDFLLLMALIVLAYSCSVAFVVAMFKVFFPMKTQEEWARIESEKVLADRNRATRMPRVGTSVLNQNRQWA